VDAYPLIKAGKYPEAIPHMEKAIRLDRNYYNAYFQLGYCLYETKKYTAAKDNLELYLQHAPNGENAEWARSIPREINRR
jgi:tetratricopeptide (TPR) repeat protein